MSRKIQNMYKNKNGSVKKMKFGTLFWQRKGPDLLYFAIWEALDNLGPDVYSQKKCFDSFVVKTDEKTVPNFKFCTSVLLI